MHDSEAGSIGVAPVSAWSELNAPGLCLGHIRTVVIQQGHPKIALLSRVTKMGECLERNRC